MNFQDLENFRLDQAVRFHDELNPAIWTDDKLQPDVRRQLLAIAQDFIDHLGLDDLDVQDITLSGSNAAYTYTPHSDLDLHLIVDMSKLDPDEVYRELFNSKKVLYNDSHDIKIHGYDVELYVQDAAEPVKSLGEYSIKNDRWIKFPSKTRSNLDERATREKFRKLVQLAQIAVANQDLDKLDSLIDTLKKYRQAGLDVHGEFGPENLAYKALRSQGIIQKLYDKRDELHSKHLSLNETDDEYAPPGASYKDVLRIKRQIDQSLNKKLISVRGRDIGGSFTDSELQAYGLRKNQATGSWTGTQAQWDRFNRDRGIKEAKKPQQHTEIIKHQVGDWVVYLDNHSMIRAATRGIGPRMMTSIITWVDRIPNLDQLVPVGSDFWIQDTQTNSSFYFKRLNIPSEPLAVRVETGVKDVPRAGSNTRVFRVNAYPGPETPQHIKNMKQLALINRFVGPDIMANRLANVVQKNPMQHPDVITNPETQDSKRYDRAFAQAKKQNKRVKESSALDKPTLTPQQIMRKHGVSYEQLIDQLTQGIKVELEHTTDSEVAYQIALAHLAEDPDYYTKLARVGLEEVTESRDSLLSWLKQQYPTWPDYVVKDFLYQGAKFITSQEQLADFLEMIKKDFGKVKWRLEKLPITLDIFTPKTQRMIKNRDGGSSNPFQVPKDAERHAQQLKMIQQQGVRTEPIIVAKLSNGYDLIEGWHRTIQHLKTFPEGYTGPAWVGYGATYTSDDKPSVAEALDKPYKLTWEPGDFGDVDAYAQLPDGSYLSIMFNKGYNKDNEEAWNVEFWRNNSQEISGQGDKFRIFATVLDAIKEFINKPEYEPNIIIFSASKKVDPGQKEQSRAGLYDSLVQRYARAWGFTVSRIDTGNKVIYEFSRIKKSVTEASGYIPSEKEKNDPRFKTALTVDVKPDSIKRNAQKLGLGRIQRAGIPPTARADGKFG